MKNKYTVLIADSDSESVNCLKERLRNEGFRVFAVDTGRSAVSYARKRDINVAVIDVNLKDFEGYILVPLIKDLKKNIKILMTTVESSSDVESKCRETGIIYYAIKPLDFNEIINVVKNAVQRLI